MDLPVLGGFCHKDTRAQSFISLAMPAFQKITKPDFPVFSTVLVMVCLFFLPENDHLLLKTTPLAPIEVEILLCRGSAQKIETDSGIKLLKIPIKKLLRLFASARVQIPTLKTLPLRSPDISTYI